MSKDAQIQGAQIHPVQEMRAAPRGFPAVSTLPSLLPRSFSQRIDTRRHEGQLVTAMNITDSIADFLTRIRNAVGAGHKEVQMPSSKLRVAITKILKEEGFIEDFEEVEAKPQSSLKIGLRYTAHKRPVIRSIQRVSKPGLRMYVRSTNIPRVLSGMGIVILSTPKGVVSGETARREKLGGEILCKVY